MAGTVPEGSHADASGLRVAIVASRYHAELVDRLVEGARGWLRGHGLADADLAVVRVPGSFEIPLAAQRMASSGRFDAVVCLGVLLRGETLHFDLIAAEAARGIGQVALHTRTPCSFGVIAADSLAHAEARCGGAMGNRGEEAARSAVEMVVALRGARG